MKKEFVPYEQSLELKELGFTITFDGWFYINGSLKWDYIDKELKDKDCHAPLYQQAFRWFREKYGLFASFVEYTNDILPEIYYMFTISGGDHYEDFNTYEEAELACLKKLIEIAKNK